MGYSATIVRIGSSLMKYYAMIQGIDYREMRFQEGLSWFMIQTKIVPLIQLDRSQVIKHTQIFDTVILVGMYECN